MPAAELKRLSPRHMLMVYLWVAGKKPSEIGEKLGYTAARVSAIAQSPLFKALVADLQRDMRESTVNKFTERIVDETFPSLDTVIELRDHAENENVRLGAANSLLDRGPLPKRTHVEGEHRLLNISLSGTDMRQMFKAMVEADGGDARVVDVTPALPQGGEREIVLRDIDEAIASLGLEDGA